MRLRFRALTDQDLAVVEGWLAQAHVSRWYLSGSSIEEELGELRKCVTGEEPTQALVVLEDDRPIGWCQWYRCDAYPEHAARVGAQAGDIGIDYAIGEPDRVGQGIGTAMIADLVAHIRREHPACGVIADPEAGNPASRRVLEKNGFRLASEQPIPSERTAEVMAIYRLPGPAAGTG